MRGRPGKNPSRKGTDMIWTSLANGKRPSWTGRRSREEALNYAGGVGADIGSARIVEFKGGY